jgi:hypothetical protein
MENLIKSAKDAWAAMHTNGALDRENLATFMEAAARIAHRILPDSMHGMSEDGFVARVMVAHESRLALKGRCRFIQRARTEDGREIDFWAGWHKSGGDVTSLVMRSFRPQAEREWADSAGSLVSAMNALTGKPSRALDAWKRTGIV